MLDELDRHGPRPAAKAEDGSLHLQYRRPDIHAVRGARQAARRLVAPLGEDHADAVELLVDELLTNAFLHGAPAFRLVVRPHDDHTVIEVHDEHPSTVFQWHDGEHRGLRIVERLSLGVTVVATSSGKCVRAVAPADPWSRRPRRSTQAPPPS